ncbi:hypothetical protein PLESTM_001054900 [Pleodorina starrii]|nr:hypothetical protein PLESTM_001054900 [Pleodorina starrii]
MTGRRRRAYRAAAAASHQQRCRCRRRCCCRQPAAGRAAGGSAGAALGEGGEDLGGSVHGRSRGVRLTAQRRRVPAGADPGGGGVGAGRGEAEEEEEGGGGGGGGGDDIIASPAVCRRSVAHSSVQLSDSLCVEPEEQPGGAELLAAAESGSSRTKAAKSAVRKLRSKIASRIKAAVRACVLRHLMM